MCSRPAAAAVVSWIPATALIIDRKCLAGHHNNLDFQPWFLAIILMESLALLDRDGHFVWTDEYSPWGWCRELIIGTPAWQWVTSDNVEEVKTAYSRCIILNEPQHFMAEVSIDGRSVDMSVWLRSTSLDEARIVATSLRLPSRMRHLTDAEKDVLRLAGDGLAPKLIAERLHLERSTVDTHRRNIMRKLRIDDAHQFQAFAVRKKKLW